MTKSPSRDEGRAARPSRLLPFFAVIVLVLAATGFGLWHFVINAPIPSPFLEPTLCGPDTPPVELAVMIDSLMGGEPAMLPAAQGALKRSLSAVPPFVLRFAYGANLRFRLMPQTSFPQACGGGAANRAKIDGVDDAPGGVSACLIKSSDLSAAGSAGSAASAASRPLLLVGVAETAEKNVDLLQSAIAQVTIPVLTGFVVNTIVPLVKSRIPPPADSEVDVEAALLGARYALAQSITASDSAFEGLVRAYGPAWKFRPEALDQVALASTAAYYCGEATLRKYEDLHPGITEAYRHGLACLLGKPWYVKNDAYAAACIKKI